MIVHLDTSALVDALTGPRRSLDGLIRLTDRGERLMLSTIVLYEWLRGPRTRHELAAQEELFPTEAAVVFGVGEAAAAARLDGVTGVGDLESGEVLGTDVGGFEWTRVHQAEEFTEMTRLGMPAADALRAGTVWAAELLGLSHQRIHQLTAADEPAASDAI
jgi:hypothetical protein